MCSAVANTTFHRIKTMAPAPHTVGWGHAVERRSPLLPNWALSPLAVALHWQLLFATTSAPSLTNTVWLRTVGRRRRQYGRPLQLHQLLASQGCLL